MGAMASGNYTYLYLTVSFIEILKGFTPVVTIVVQALFGQAFPRPIAGVAVLMISLGTSISSFGEIDLNLLGVSLMLGSAITLFFFVLYNVFQFHPELGERLWERWSGR